MTRRFLQIVLLFAAMFLGAISSLAQGKRVALVIGNSEYKHTPRLANPKNDATDMAEALKQLNFAVTVGKDLDKAAMDRTIRDFAEALSGAQAGLFFYAGHGLQVSGQNYLVPTDAKLTSASAIDFEMVRLDLLHRTMEREANTNIIIIDACRDNPLARNLARALGTRSTQIGRGFAAVESGEGTLISFSTQPGNVALDGTGRNSPYAGALLKHITTPGDDLPTILINVRNEVMRETERRQVPWEHSAMTAKFYFIPPRPTAQQIEFQFWTSVKDSTSPAVLGTYLEKYPTGDYARIARALIDHYDRQLKLELAARDEERKRQEEQLRAAEAKRLQDDQRARETTAIAERKKVEETSRLDDRSKTELALRTEELRKAVEEARLAREAAKEAEGQRLAALKAAERATQAAEEAIAKKREAEKAGDTARVAALPKIEKPAGVQQFDGAWTITWRGEPCGWKSTDSFRIRIEGGIIIGKSGSVAASGAARWLQASNYTKGVQVPYSGAFRANSGSGTFHNQTNGCKGTWTAVRN